MILGNSAFLFLIFIKFLIEKLINFKLCDDVLKTPKNNKGRIIKVANLILLLFIMFPGSYLVLINNFSSYEDLVIEFLEGDIFYLNTLSFKNSCPSILMINQVHL